MHIVVDDEREQDEYKTLPPCDKPHVSETHRTEDKDDACDDGIG